MISWTTVIAFAILVLIVVLVVDVCRYVNIREELQSLYEEYETRGQEIRQLREQAELYRIKRTADERENENLRCQNKQLSGTLEVLLVQYGKLKEYAKAQYDMIERVNNMRTTLYLTNRDAAAALHTDVEYETRQYACPDEEDTGPCRVD